MLAPQKQNSRDNMSLGFAADPMMSALQKSLIAETISGARATL